ncbi:MAG: murein biosynthesis integral membrane protein MurJ [Caldilineaceae bacterium]|nr:murein biosynthesis integral membrane protein MurJ [Caldilineaceae bacterium]
MTAFVTLAQEESPSLFPLYVTIRGMSEPEQLANVESPAAVQPGLAGSASLLAMGSAASRILGLAREVMINTLFGATGEVSAFRIASQVPLMLYDFLIGGMLSAALVPVLSQYAQRRDRGEFGRLVGILATILGALLLFLVGLLQLFAPQLTRLLARGFEDDPALLALTTYMIQLTLPAVWLLCMAGLATAALYALQRFSFPALATAIYNLGLLVTAPLLAQQLGIVALVVGMVVGTAAQLSVMAFDLWRAGIRLRLWADWRHPALAQIVRLYLPIALGVVVSLFQVGLDRRLATSTQAESVAWMSSATTLQQMPLGLISVAISMAALPQLSQFFAQKDEASYRATLGRGLRMVLLLIVPAAMLLWTLGEPLIRLLFEHNQFKPTDTVQVAAALNIYVVGMIFAAVDYPLNFAFYARHNTRLPAIVGVISVVFYLLAAWALLQPLGYLGLVWADSAKQIGHMLIMLTLLNRQVGMRREILGQGTLWIALAGVGAGLATWALTLGLNGLLAPGLGRDLALLVGAGGGGLLCYVLVLRWARLPELVSVGAWAQHRFGRDTQENER